MKKTALRAMLALGALVALAATSAGCGGPYVPSVKDGKCNVGRQWVPPAEEGGKWREGYCKEG